jgi:flavin-binding protein dodecin
MPDHVYRIIEVAGSSEKSIEDAIQNAVGRASRTLRQVGWFEVVERRAAMSKTVRWPTTRSPLKSGSLSTTMLDRRGRREQS